MADAKTFCTCVDTACPNHPANHDEGCARCIRKCLALGEIPSCFFNAAGIDAHTQTSWFYADFARAVLAKEAEKKAENEAAEA